MPDTEFTQPTRPELTLEESRHYMKLAKAAGYWQMLAGAAAFFCNIAALGGLVVLYRSAGVTDNLLKVSVVIVATLLLGIGAYNLMSYARDNLNTIAGKLLDEAAEVIAADIVRRVAAEMAAKANTEATTTTDAK